VNNQGGQIGNDPVNVVLIEFPDEVDSFLSYCRRKDLSPSGFHVVGLWPNVRVALEREGIRCSDTLPYFDNGSHERILLRSEDWLRTIESSVKIEDGLGIRETYGATVVFHLRFYMNYFLWLLEILTSISRQHTVGSFIVCSESGPLCTSGPSLGSNDRYLASITRGYATGRDIEVDEIQIESRPRALRQSAIKGILSSVSGLLHRLALARLRGGGILVNAVTYNMDRLIRELKQSFPKERCVWLTASPIPPEAALYGLVRHDPADHFLALDGLEMWAPRTGQAVAKVDSGLRELNTQFEGRWKTEFQYHGVSFTETFAGKIERDLWPYVRSLARRSETIRYVLRKTKPSLVLAAFSADSDALLGEWTRVLGVPSLSISHGTHTPPNSEPDEIEKYRLGTTLILTSFGHTAMQTPWAEKYLSYFNDRRHPTPLKTGNLILANLAPAARREARHELLGEESGKKIIVYATTLKPRSGLRFEIHETLDEHLAGIAHLARAIGEIDDAVLVVKLHPAAALKEDEVRLLVPETRSERVRIMCRVPFEKVLSSADLLVSYSSTCIEDAIQNGVPVLLYDPWDRYEHVPAGRHGRSSPAYYVNDAGMLGDTVRWILDGHDPNEIPPEVWREHIYPAEVREDFVSFVAGHLGTPAAEAAVSN
jgi:hypothetical protein